MGDTIEMRAQKHIGVKEVEEKTRVKRPMVGVSLGYPLYDEVKVAAESEPVRGMAAFVMEVFRYGFRAYRELGSLKALKSSEPPRMPASSSKRVSEETCAMLAEALDIILQRAPSTVIEEMTRYLTARAGKYGEPKKK